MTFVTGRFYFMEKECLHRLAYLDVGKILLLEKLHLPKELLKSLGRSLLGYAEIKVLKK